MSDRNWSFLDWRKYCFLLSMFVFFSFLSYMGVLPTAKLDYSNAHKCDCNVSSEDPPRLKVLVLSYSRLVEGRCRKGKVIETIEVRVVSAGRTDVTAGVLLLLLRAAVAAEHEL